MIGWSSRKIKRVVRSSLEAECSSLATCIEALGWARTLWAEMTTGRVQLQNHEAALKENKAMVCVDCKSLYDALIKEGAAPNSADRRLAIELAICKRRLVDGDIDIRWIDSRYQMADCLTKHASAKSEEVLLKVLTSGRWRVTSEQSQLEVRAKERQDTKAVEGEEGPRQRKGVTRRR